MEKMIYPTGVMNSLKKASQISSTDVTFPDNTINIYMNYTLKNSLKDFLKETNGLHYLMYNT